MPTSNQEAQAIVEIVDEYLEQDKARELMARLNENVGATTDNSSLKISLQMLDALYAPPPPKKHTFKKVALALVILWHMGIVIINAAAFFVLPFLLPLWVWVPIDSFILTVMFTREICPLTRLENSLRTSIGLPRIGGFVGHYFVRPVRQLSKNRQLRKAKQVTNG
jgi:hypothetical protein